MPSTSAYLSLQNLCKSFGDFPVVKNVTIPIEKGELVSFLGPSGCGKTTTLRMVAGFISHDRGAISLDGQRIDNVPTHKRGVSMVFQNFALFPHMTIAENVAFGLRMQNKETPGIARAVDEMLDRVQLLAHRHKYPKQLSGGQQQRVALARALVVDPKVLLLDEPLSSLDTKLRRELRDDIRDLQKARGATAIFVTHDLEEAFAISDKVAVMHDGQVAQYGSPMEIFRAPASRFVADFIGYKNLLTGKVSRTDSRLVVVDNQPVRVQSPGIPGADVFLGIPSNRIIVSRIPLDTENAFQARVDRVTQLGASIAFQVTASCHALNAEMTTTAEAIAIAENDTIHVGWRPEDAVIVPAP